MTEGTKIMITALSSFGLGILMEPIRAQISLRFQVLTLRRALCQEFEIFYRTLYYEWRAARRGKPNWIEARTYDFHVMAKALEKPDVLYSIKEWRRYFIVWKIAKQFAQENDHGLEIYAMVLLHEIDKAIEQGKLPKRLLQGTVDSNYQEDKAYRDREMDRIRQSSKANCRK